MKHISAFVAGVVAMSAISTFAQETGLPPVKTSVVTTQRIGDLVVQSTVTPTWYVPNGVAVAVPAGQPNTSNPPSRSATQPPQSGANVVASTGTSSGTSQVAPHVTTVVVTQEVAPKAAVETRKSSTDWKQKVETLTDDIESNKLALVDAQAQLLAAAEEEKRAAEEQVAAAQRRLEATRKQAERVSAYATSLQASTAATQPPASGAKPAEAVVVAPAAPVPTFTLQLQDRTIPAALTRWSEEAGYKLLWEAKEDPASYEATYRKPFADAVDDVMRDLQLAGRDVRMCEYKNKVVRIIPRLAPCKFPPNTENAVQLGANE